MKKSVCATIMLVSKSLLYDTHFQIFPCRQDITGAHSGGEEPQKDQSTAALQKYLQCSFSDSLPSRYIERNELRQNPRAALQQLPHRLISILPITAVYGKVVFRKVQMPEGPELAEHGEEPGR